MGFQSNEIAASIGKEEKYFPWLERRPSRIRLRVVLLISHGAPLWSSKNTALLPSWLSTHIVQWGARARPESRVAKPYLSLRFLAASKENSLRAITFVERTVCSFTFDEREG